MSTPPSSPPPSNTSPTASQAFPSAIPEDTPEPPEMAPLPTYSPVKVTSEIAFELRTRLLETIVVGGQQSLRTNSKTPTLIRDIEDVQRKLDAAVQGSGSDALKWFVENYDQYKQYLTPAFALSGIIPTSPPLYENMSPNEVEAYLAEMDPDIRAADRDLREIDILDQKDVTAAHSLPEYHNLQPRLDALLAAHEETRRKRAELEKRVTRVMNQYATTTDNLSELFVAWDDTLYSAESEVGKIERDRDERRRLGLA